MSEPYTGGDTRAEGWWARFLGEEDLSNGFPLSVASLLFEASHVVKAGAGTLFGFSGFNNKGSAQFILCFDANTLPANGAVPNRAPLSVPAGNTFSMDYGQWGVAFQRGIVLANSSTAATLTIGSADVFFDAQYV